VVEKHDSGMSKPIESHWSVESNFQQVTELPNTHICYMGTWTRLFLPYTKTVFRACVITLTGLFLRYPVRVIWQ
jgi:hypothetical protein